MTEQVHVPGGFPEPSIGRIVHYKLSANDVVEIRRLRNFSYRAYRGNDVQPEQVYPAIIVRVWDEHGHHSTHLQAFLDGTDTHWVQGALHRPLEHWTEGTFAWPLAHYPSATEEKTIAELNSQDSMVDRTAAENAPTPETAPAGTNPASV